jgi:hypothetical protein
MFKNYLKIAFRHLLQHKPITSINIIGLAGYRPGKIFGAFALLSFFIACMPLFGLSG